MTIDNQEISVSLEQQERYRFLIDFGLEKGSNLLVDEDPPLGKNEGPDPSRLLAAATAHCLISSLLFCLEKARINVKGLKATARAQFGRNEENMLRVTQINVDINGWISGKENHNIDRCLEIFEKYCTVSQSIQVGIPINVKVKID